MYLVKQEHLLNFYTYLSVGQCCNCDHCEQLCIVFPFVFWIMYFSYVDVAIVNVGISDAINVVKVLQ